MSDQSAMNDMEDEYAMSQDKLVAAQEPIAWKDVVSAINAVAKEAASRGGMFPQEASEQREDSEAAKRVCGMIEWYATCGGSVAMRLPDWPLYDHGAACARCEEAERIESIATAKLGEEIIKNGVLQDKLAKQAAEIERLSSHVEDAKEIIQKMMKVEKQQADRIKAPEAFVQKLEYANTEAGNDSIALRRKLVAAESKLTKADAVILQAKDALQEVQDLIHESRGIYGMHMNGDESPWIELEQGGRFERLCTLPDALSDIEQYQKGE